MEKELSDLPRISSQTLLSSKKRFPVFFFGLLALLAVGMLLGGNPFRGARGQAELAFLSVPFLMGAIAYFLAKRRAVDVAEEVLDAGDRLVFRWGGGREEQIALAAITNLRYSQFASPQRITLTLPGAAGEKREVSFVPRKSFPQSLRPLFPNPLVQELIDRIKAAHQAQRPPVPAVPPADPV